MVMHRNKKIISLLIVIIMVGTAFAFIGSTSQNLNQGVQEKTSSPTFSSESGMATPSTTHTPWQMPTTTMEEPGYTNGTFNCSLSCTVGDLNPITGISEGDIFIYQWIYSTLFITLPDGQIAPWLATNYSVRSVSTDNQTFDIETGKMVNYSAIYTVNLRANVPWSDWTKENTSQTYTLSNHTCFYENGNKTYHTYHSFNSTVMKKYYLQSGDVVLSWRLESALGEWPDVVNVVPNGNLSVRIYVTHAALLILSQSLQDYVLPYNVWNSHDFTSLRGLYNCTPGITAGNGYYGWDLGWNQGTGSAPGLVGNGPFMVTNGFGLPQGKIVPSNVETFYVNPYFFTQYANESSGLRQYTPKFYELKVDYYSSESGAVAAFTKGQLDMIGFSPSFLPVIEPTSGAYIYHEPSCCFCAVRLNENYSPLNITKFRQALAFAVPYTYIDSVIMDGYGTPSSNDVPPSNILWVNDSAPEYTYDMAKAREMIDSIPGMSNISGVLFYYGNPVTLQFQVLPGSQDPCDIQKMESTASSWNSLGIKTTIVEVSCSTEISNIFNTVSGLGNYFQVGNFGQGTATTDPAIDFAEYVNTNPIYFGVGCNLGPFTSLNYNGKELTGKQVQSMLNNMSNALINAVSITKATQIAKEMETIVIDEVPWINLGFRTNFIAYQENQFANFTKLTSKTTFSTFFTLLEVYKSNKVIVKTTAAYHLGISEKFCGSTVEESGDTGQILYTVINETTHLPVYGATVAIAVSSIAGGLLNISSDQMVTNHNGQAVWKYKVYPELDNLLVTCTALCNLINIPFEDVNISATAIAPSSQIMTERNTTYQDLILINNAMKDNLQLSSTYTGSNHLYAGQSGTISYMVKNYTGSAVTDANITVVVSDITNSITSTSYQFNTSTSNTGTFNFSVSSLLPQLMQTYDSAGNPVNIYDQQIEITAVACVGNQNQT